MDPALPERRKGAGWQVWHGDHCERHPSRPGRARSRGGGAAATRCGATARTAGNAVVKGLPGTITLLRDAGYSVEEILRWLFTVEDSLPGTPIGALRTDRGREVKRRAQAMGF